MRRLDLDQVGLRRLDLRQRDRQQAVLVRRLDLLRGDRGRQRERPLERAVGALIAMHLLGLLLGHLRHVEIRPGTGQAVTQRSELEDAN